MIALTCCAAAHGQLVVADPNFVPGGGGYSSRAATYQWDDGAGENNYRFNVTGEYAMLAQYASVPGAEYITSVSIAWGGGCNGMAARVCVWEDPNDDGNPTDAVLLAVKNVVGANASSNIFNEYLLDSPVSVNGKFFVGFVVTANASQFPIRIDAQPSYVAGRLWYAVSSSTLDLNNLGSAAIPPTDWNASGGALGYEMIRASGTNGGITYQGELKEADAPAAGPVDLRFRLLSSSVGGSQIGPTALATNVALVDGRFTVQLPFEGVMFDGNARWLAIEVAPAGSGSFTALSPRQPLTAAPMAHHSYTADRSLTADSASSASWSGLIGIPPGFADGVDNDSGGDITAVVAGPGLIGGSASGSATLSVAFGTSGVLATAARSDHTHNWSELLNIPSGFADGVDNDSGGDITAVVAGTGLTGGSTSGTATLNVAFAGNGVANTAARSDHSHSISSLDASDGSPADVVQVDATGNVGVGITPTTRLHVLSSNLITGTTAAVTGGDFAVTLSTGQGMRFAYQGIQSVLADGSANNLRLNPVGGGISMFAPVNPADSVLYVDGSVGIGTVTPATLLHLASTASPTLRWQDTSAGGKSFHIGIASADDTFRIAESGVGDRVIITGTTGLVGIARVPTANRLEVEGNASKTASGSWLANSDARIKTNVRSVTNALDTLDKVRLVSFDYTPSYLAAHPGLEHRRYLNVIAQEFAQVFPDHVKPSGEKLADGSSILQVDTHPLTIYAAAAVKELNSRLKESVNAQKSTEQSLRGARGEIDRLTMENRQLRERLDQIESKLNSLSR
ncbi:MAG: tail fiber domain-containing protein [Planctomycetes bacterium]|nr:tail fiber domain-containing protein [Planctomycetota bacterium]